MGHLRLDARVDIYEVHWARASAGDHTKVVADGVNRIEGPQRVAFGIIAARDISLHAETRL